MTVVTAPAKTAVTMAVLAGLAFVIGCAQLGPAGAVEPVHSHALSLLGEVKYPANFKHHDYVNPQAPKGGVVRLSAVGSFDSLNPFLYKGVAASGLGLIYNQLMVASLDEGSTEYCSVCEWVSHPDDYSSVTFKLRENARWHDGKPITAEDVAFSMESLKAADPREALYYKNCVRWELQGDRQITFHFDIKGNRELPSIIGQLTILPKHFWTGVDKEGKPRNIMNTTLEIPLGSGPYRVKESIPARSIAFERVPDYWGKDLPTAVGLNNFDEVRFEYFRDATPVFEAFKAGQIDFYRETSAKNWATRYDFSAVTDGRVKKREIGLRRVQGMQGYIFNLRRDKFKDRKIRQAFALAYDFEWANANLFYGQYKRTASFFENSELASRDVPTGQELEILNTVKDQLPPELFTTPYANPVNGTTDVVRTNLAQAAKLFGEAGWINKGGVLTNAAGQTMSLEILLVQPDFERVTLPYVKALERLGAKVTVRIIDSPQYKRRVDNYDFDIIIGEFPQSESPGNEQRFYWSSGAADQPGGHNYAGLKNPGIDILVDRVILAKDRAELIAATHALDRALLWNQIVVPNWYLPQERVALWDRFGEPQVLPSRSDGFPTVWWYDATKAKKLTEAR